MSDELRICEECGKEETHCKCELHVEPRLVHPHNPFRREFDYSSDLEALRILPRLEDVEDMAEARAEIKRQNLNIEWWIETSKHKQEFIGEQRAEIERLNKRITFLYDQRDKIWEGVNTIRGVANKLHDKIILERENDNG